MTRRTWSAVAVLALTAGAGWAGMEYGKARIAANAPVVDCCDDPACPPGCSKTCPPNCADYDKTNHYCPPCPFCR
jgi:hypothetical protein